MYLCTYVCMYVRMCDCGFVMMQVLNVSRWFLSYFNSLNFLQIARLVATLLQEKKRKKRGEREKTA